MDSKDNQLGAMLEAEIPEMVERVARAILLARPFFKPEEIVRAQVGNWPIWHQAIVDARAAIAAMREPTAAMQKAGAVASAKYHVTSEAWCVMIDAALKE
jgi:hypothetical protein